MFNNMKMRVKTALNFSMFE